jgi:peptidoglycan biosynthesis protein MviN/MurJ (putative lipid II flippase)
MTRGLGVIALAIVAVWVVAHLLYIGPVQDAAEITLVWALGLGAASLVGASIVLLAVAMAQGGTRPAWLRFVRGARNAAAVIGCALVLVGLLHYRETEPQGEIYWVVLGLVVLAGAGVVHWWVVREIRRQAA